MLGPCQRPAAARQMISSTLPSRKRSMPSLRLEWHSKSWKGTTFPMTTAHSADDSAPLAMR